MSAAIDKLKLEAPDQYAMLRTIAEGLGPLDIDDRIEILVGVSTQAVEQIVQLVGKTLGPEPLGLLMKALQEE